MEKNSKKNSEEKAPMVMPWGVKAVFAYYTLILLFLLVVASPFNYVGIAIYLILLFLLVKRGKWAWITILTVGAVGIVLAFLLMAFVLTGVLSPEAAEFVTVVDFIFTGVGILLELLVFGLIYKNKEWFLK